MCFFVTITFYPFVRNKIKEAQEKAKKVRELNCKPAIVALYIYLINQA